MNSGKSSFGKSNGILEDIEIKELVDYNIPFSVVTSEILDIPPIIIELTISKSDKFPKKVHPRV